jgi:hypothetical protein
MNSLSIYEVLFYPTSISQMLGKFHLKRTGIILLII